MVEQGDRIFGMKKYLRDKYQYKRKSDFFQYLSLFLLGARWWKVVTGYHMENKGIFSIELWSLWVKKTILHIVQKP